MIFLCIKSTDVGRCYIPAEGRVLLFDMRAADESFIRAHGIYESELSIALRTSDTIVGRAFAELALLFGERNSGDSSYFDTGATPGVV
jgi:hypothetical protein